MRCVSGSPLYNITCVSMEWSPVTLDHAHSQWTMPLLLSNYDCQLQNLETGLKGDNDNNELRDFYTEVLTLTNPWQFGPKTSPKPKILKPQPQSKANQSKLMPALWGVLDYCSVSVKTQNPNRKIIIQNSIHLHCSSDLPLARHHSAWGRAAGVYASITSMSHLSPCQ